MVKNYKGANGRIYQADPLQLMSIAEACRDIIACAQADGIRFSKAQMLDLVADNLDDIPLDTLRAALVCAGVGY